MSRENCLTLIFAKIVMLQILGAGEKWPVSAEELKGRGVGRLKKLSCFYSYPEGRKTCDSSSLLSLLKLW